MVKGKKHSEETKQKIRLAHLGKKYKPMSEQGKENIRKEINKSYEKLQQIYFNLVEQETLK